MAENKIDAKVDTKADNKEEKSIENQTQVQTATSKKAASKPKAKKKATKETKETKQEKLPDFRANIKLFDKWSTLGIEVKDISLKPYINLTPFQVPYSAGRGIKKQFWKSKKSIIERLAAKLMVPGHKGKKHYWTSNVNSGKTTTHFKILVKAFDEIEKKTGKNPVEVLIRAIEAAAPREGIATIEYGGVRYPKAADLAPQRRIDLALRWIVQGAFLASLKGKKHMPNALAEEIIATAAGDTKANAISKKTELERQAAASR